MHTICKLSHFKTLKNHAYHVRTAPPVTPVFALAALNLAAIAYAMGLPATPAQKKHRPSLKTHLFLTHPAAYTVPRNINPKGTI